MLRRTSLPELPTMPVAGVPIGRDRSPERGSVLKGDSFSGAAESRTFGDGWKVCG